MHQGRPYGLHVVGLPLTDKDQAFIDATAKRITNLKSVSGVDSMKMVYDLPDGGYVIVQDMGGNFRVIAHKPLPDEKVLFDGIATDFIPMLYSGSITKAVVADNEGVGIRLTKTTRHRLRQYNPNDSEPPKDVALHRFRVSYDYAFQEFMTTDSRFLRTQYTQLRPTWYSGAMAEVMQIVGGYGIQDTAYLPDEPLERAQLMLPPEVVKSIREEMGSGLRLPGFTGLPDAGGKFKYDYKFNKTNVIGFDDNRKPWLLQIAANGVWAMPLPIIPATATAAFRRHMEDVGDDEVLKILDRFGAMPSGETFPVGNEFQSWRRAGAIIKVCDSSDFYSHIAYSSACGWSVNERGDEGYNTCYDYYDDEGLGYGLTYKLKLYLKSSPAYTGAPPASLDGSDLRTQKVARYMEALLPTVGTNTGDARATLYKLRRMTFDQLYDRAIYHKGEEDLEYWRNLEVEPIAAHSGSITEVYRGYLYHPAKFAYQPQIKFPEPFAGGCLSHDFLPLENGRFKDKYPNSDTIMYAYYEENSLKTIKYFIDWGKYEQETESNYESYMTVGNWWKEETAGFSELQGYFYSSDIDDREIVAPSTTSTAIEGRDRGYDAKPFFSFNDFFSKAGMLWRNRYFTHKTSTTKIDGRSLALSVCIPYLCRNAAIHTKKEESATRVDSEMLTLKSIQDPTSYKYWTFHFDLAWVGGTGVENPKGNPYPVDGSPVWVEEAVYSPHPSNDFANNGPWITSLPQDYTWLIHPNSNEWHHMGGGGPPVVQTYSTSKTVSGVESGMVRLSFASNVDLINKNIPDGGYYTSSPTEFGNIFYRDAAKVVFGDATYRNVSEPSARSPRAFWGSCNVADNKSAHHFIGVINE